MTEGRVSDEMVPLVTLDVAGRAWAAIIDTGFNGDLELPESHQRDLNPRFAGRVASLLAAGQEIEEDVYLVEFPFDGDVVLAQATFAAATEILVGTHLIRDHRLEISFRARTVVIERE